MAPLDEDFWEPVLEAYESAPSLAFAMAQGFAILQRKLTKGPEGAQEVIQSLENGVKELYQYTHFHQACFKLYRRAISPKGLATHLDPTMIVENLDKPEPRKTKRSAKKKVRSVQKKREQET